MLPGVIWKSGKPERLMIPAGSRYHFETDRRVEHLLSQNGIEPYRRGRDRDGVVVSVYKIDDKFIKFCFEQDKKFYSSMQVRHG